MRNRRHAFSPLCSLVCMLTLAAGGIAAVGTHAAAETASVSASDRPAVPEAHAAAADTLHGTAWAASVHAAFSRQARHAVEIAREAYTQSGVASWYGYEFAGRRTSSGARFNPMQLTCAHRTQPLGSRLLVTSQETGRSVVVTVTDRGPYAGADRIIDLSRAAASRIGMVQTGLNTVIVKRIASDGGDVEVAQAPDADDSDQALKAAEAGDVASSGGADRR